LNIYWRDCRIKSGPHRVCCTAVVPGFSRLLALLIGWGVKE